MNRVLELRAAESADLAAVAALLERTGLPVEGVADQFGDNYILATAAGGLAGVAGIERFGPFGLLRSVAVEPDERNHGLAARLVRDRLAWAAADGMSAVYLLTMTAAAYFPRFGFERVSREEAPEEIRTAREFTSSCPASAVLMRAACARCT
jgi:amino-acid N-acetyltransferase